MKTFKISERIDYKNGFAIHYLRVKEHVTLIIIHKEHFTSIVTFGLFAVIVNCMNEIMHLLMLEIVEINPFNAENSINRNMALHT